MPPTRRRRRARRPALAALFATAALTVASLTAGAPAAHAAASPLIRVDQAGYLPGEVKQAYLMTGAAISSASFSVVNSAGTTVLTGSVGGTSRGSWNTAYPDVYPITFTALTAPGTYHLTVSGEATASSPTFKVEDPAALYGKLVADGVTFFQTQRDGSNVIPGLLIRQASHLNDASASVYAWPGFQSGGSDTITNSDLSRIGGPVDVSGGWFDAGDYLKFTHTTAFGDAVLFAGQRALGSAAPASLAAEAHVGEQWLAKMWNQSSKTLYLQVGIGSGNAAGTFYGDHDLWRLPQKDDGDTASADRYAAAHRPVFQAAAPGALISPNLAGRVSAAFALAAQVDAQSNPTQAAAEYQAATSLYAQAATASPPNPLTTALPGAYYPESTWHDDMEFGATEIALAAQALGHSASSYLSQAATWANDYITGDTGDTFNLYDTSALAHADLIKAITAAGNPSGLAVSTSTLLGDLKRQVQAAATKASSDIFHAGGDYTDFDVDAHTFGFLTTEALYKQAGGGTSFDAFATEQRDWLLGANAWGTSFMVGEGSTFPHCPQHQVANLAGSTNGTGAIAVGAVVNGPNNTSNFTGGLGSYQTGMVACPAGGADPFNAFTGHSSRFADDVRSWQTDEPALDMTAAAVLGAALQQAANSGGTATDDFSLSVNPASASVAQGSSAQTAVSTSVTSGSAQSVTLSASGLPTGATATFNPASLTAGSGGTLTVTTSATTPAGTYPVTVTGTAATGSHTAAYTLTVTTGSTTSDFSLALSPTSGSVTAGSSATTTVSTAVTSGSAESVALAASGLPAGATASFSPTSVTSGATSTLTVATSASTPAGTYPVTVTGSAASGSHTATYTLTVTSASGGTCNPAWSASTSYVPGDKVSYGGHNYTALYWSTDVTPGSAIAWNIWQDDGPC